MSRSERRGRSPGGARAWLGYHIETIWLLGLLTSAVVLGALVVKL
ncbi:MULTISPECIES: hypothetical protein [unclassified Streptomyces]|nr:hypothetical protein [Streptomyces sp. NBC_00223]